MPFASPRAAIRGLLVVLAFSVLSSTAVAQLRMMTFNVANRPDNATHDADINTIMTSLGNDSVAGIQRPVDVLVLQELSNVAQANRVANELNSIYGSGSYSVAFSVSGTADDSALIYRNSSVQFLGQQTISTSGPRPTFRYQLRPQGYDANADFYVYNSHLKASNMPSDEATRASETSTIRANANALGANAHVLYAGDLNIYNPGEAAYSNLLAAGNGQAFDPLGNFQPWGGPGNAIKHTQSPHNSGLGQGGLVGGGMDDRFDFQLPGNQFGDGDGLAYIPGSYRAFGNDGTNYNQPLATSPADGAVKFALARSFDHIPVVADYQIPARMLVGGLTGNARVMQNSAANGTVLVDNSAVGDPDGIDNLTFSYTTSGDASGSGTGGSLVNDPATPVSVALNTATLGGKSASIEVDATSEGVPAGDSNQIRNFNYTVVTDRSIAASGVDFGRVLVGVPVPSQNSTLTTAGADSMFTRVTVNDINTSQNGIVANPDVSQLFNDSNDTLNVVVGPGSFATSGNFNGNLPLSVTGEGLAGESVNPASIPYNAEVFAPASLNSNQGSQLVGSSQLITNASDPLNGQRAAARVASRNITGDAGFGGGIAVGTTITPGGFGFANATFNTAGKLNGSHRAVYDYSVEHDDQTILGTSGGDLGNLQWTVTANVSGRTGDGASTLLAGQAYDGFGISRGTGQDSMAVLLDGAASIQRTVSMSWDDAPGFVSDELTLLGTGSDIYVLEMSYNPSLIVESTAELLWFNPAGMSYELAINGNTGGSANFVGDTAYNPATHFALGTYGVDTASNTVWAVLNHNSRFVVDAAPIPEPTTLAMLAVGALVMRRRRRA